MYAAGCAGSTGTRRRDDGLGFALPNRAKLQALFEIAHAGEILIEPVAVARADVALQFLGLVGHGVEDAPPGVQLADLRLRPPRRCLAGTAA